MISTRISSFFRLASFGILGLSFFIFLAFVFFANSFVEFNDLVRWITNTIVFKLGSWLQIWLNNNGTKDLTSLVTLKLGEVALRVFKFGNLSISASGKEVIFHLFVVRTVSEPISSLDRQITNKNFLELLWKKMTEIYSNNAFLSFFCKNSVKSIDFTSYNIELFNFYYIFTKKLSIYFLEHDPHLIGEAFLTVFSRDTSKPIMNTIHMLLTELTLLQFHLLLFRTSWTRSSR